ncbi:MAG: AAA family ATPase [Sphingobacteriales bacterium]|jgi:SpoVK/Ycf46/Vps4 family AAA+-type ATPase|nr:MAG: AAA family ATPase [Sphingobacteriales bacterium]
MFFSQKNNSEANNKFKLKHINVYGSTEWMANSTKKYRTVYDVAEVDYLNAEVAIYNKLFDEEDWSCKIEIKAFNKNDLEKAICNLDANLEVSKEDNIIYYRDGWGVPTKGTFWKAGTYLWKAYLDGEFIGEKEFIINDIGLVTNNNNPYFRVEYIKLFSGDGNANIIPESERKYLKKFNSAATQYVWLEMKLTNLTNKPWDYEIFFNYYDDAWQHKAQTFRIGKIEASKKDWTYTFDVGWGSDVPGGWKDDKYILDVVFMDCSVALAAFECGKEDVEGETPLTKKIENIVSAQKSNASDNLDTDKTLDELLVELNELVGLENVKNTINEQITYLKFANLRKQQGIDDDANIKLHAVAYGNPGTGKTTVMRLLGKIYHKLDLLSLGHLNEVNRVDLVAEFIGQTAPKTQKVIEKSKGGILFIDEAYALARSGEDSKDYGKEVIEILIKEMSEGTGDIAIFCAGYPKEMEVFLQSNPGLKSRFGQYFNFQDYLPEELFQIAIKIAEKSKLTFSKEAQVELKEYLTEAYRKRDKNFGNARFVEGVVGSAKMELGIRLMKDASKQYSKEELSTIILEDVKKITEQEEHKKLVLEVDIVELQDALTELHQLIGMNTVKKEIDELVKLIMYYNEIGKDVLNKFSLHTVFTGNPGTGKTTVARILGKIFKSLGILERGHVVEVDREQLVAGFIGQTAIKTGSKIEEAMGGVLFIDEAYALTKNASSGNDFGSEAIEIILKRMEDNRGKFVVLAAGYPDNMNEFLLSNPGLNSRFDKKIHFDDYTPEELWQIAESLFKKDDLEVDEIAKQHIQQYFALLYKNKDKFFGNARTVRQTTEDVIKKQNIRMATLDKNSRTQQAIHTITIDDVQHLAYKENLRNSIGF